MTESLIKRYKGNTPPSSLAGTGRLDKGIEKGEGQAGFSQKDADFILTAASSLPGSCGRKLEKIFLKHQEYCNMFVTVLSFGFKYGIPEDADLSFSTCVSAQSLLFGGFAAC